MPRLFIGIALPETVRERLAIIRGPLTGARWVEPTDLHITLRFIGDVDNRQADELVGFLDAIDAAPFDIELRDVGAFGGRDPKIIWAGAEGGEPLAHLQRATERAARGAGSEPEKRAFKPHVTLARLSGASPNDVAAFLGSRGGFKGPSFKVDEFVLFSSRPHQGGGPYVVENVFPLASQP